MRFEFEPAPALETLMLHFCGEIRLNHWYRRASEWHTEPVIKHIYTRLSQDEARHGGAYLRYMKRAINNFGNEAKAAFAKVGVLMASARRTAQALHPTNLHVNKSLFPRDTIQSRLPNPEWLEHWLDKQINFDAVWENKVVERILHNMSLLLDRSFKSVQELNRYRKEVAAALLRAPRRPLRSSARREPRLPGQDRAAATGRRRVAALPQPVVFTNGVFDVLHRGHAAYLAQARELGASLVVALNTDASAQAPGQGPRSPAEQRAGSRRRGGGARIGQPRAPGSTRTRRWNSSPN